eukprot:c3457_g1_i1 orf=174-1262(+)
MGNTLRRLCGLCFSPPQDDLHVPQGGAVVHQQAAPLGPHGVSVDTIGFSALARDLFQFEITGQVPDGLSKYVQSSRAAQAKWYRKLLTAWKTSQPLPSNAREASQLVIQALQGHRKVDVEGLLSFYGLPSVAVPVPAVVITAPPALYPQVAIATGPWPKGVQYELYSLSVESHAAVDGDTLVVYVDTSNDAREAAAVPLSVQAAVSSRRAARQQRDFNTADALQKQINKCGYKVIDAKNGSAEVIARKYRIRLRGIDAPENSMPFGLEAKAMLQSIVDGQPLHLLVYDVDQYGRLVADIYCCRGFVQEILLKNGGCWHYTTYDKRQEFAKWEAEARTRRLGLWEEDSPRKPWEYRKANPRSG